MFLTSRKVMSGVELISDDQHTFDYTDDDDDDSEDQFYDHDQCYPSTKSSRSSLPTSAAAAATAGDEDHNHIGNNNVRKQFNLVTYMNCTTTTLGHKRPRRSIYYTITVLFIGVCIVLFIISLVQYTHCNLTSVSYCHYSHIVTRLNNNIAAMNRRLLSYLPNHSYNWIAWPIYSTANTTNLTLDPLFSWFFNQYAPN